MSAGSWFRSAFALGAASSDVAVIIVATLGCGAAYHWAVYDTAGPVRDYLQLGLLIALLYVLPKAVSDAYEMGAHLSPQVRTRAVLPLWNVAFLGALGIGFLTKILVDTSRGTVLLLYVAGPPALWLAHAARARLAREMGLGTRRVHLVGYEEQIEAFRARYELAKLGLHVVAASVLRIPVEGEAHGDVLSEDLALAVSTSRFLRPDDVLILVPWSCADVVDRSADAFVGVPASIHLGPERVLDRFKDVCIQKVGPIASLRLVRRPLSTPEIVAKRAVDVVLAVGGLVLLAPLLAVVALLIRSESRGGVLFAQQRYGFNQQPFRIFKFRSMTTVDDGRVVPQATRHDPRVTRVGRWIRRWSIDELPQLLNVVLGNMSLVGPRPHALAHDQAYERRIARYARRHNVKPGITGWAQVNGCRGETSTDELMRRRVEHDLYYIDNWSLTFDLKILVLTVFSPRTYRNAY